MKGFIQPFRARCALWTGAPARHADVAASFRRGCGRASVFASISPDSREIRFYNAYTLQKKSILCQYKKYIKNFLIDFKCKILIISHESRIVLCDLNTGQHLSTITDESSYMVKLLATGTNSKFTLLVSCDCYRVLKVWNLDTKQLLHTLHGHTDELKCAAISPDGKILVSGSLDTTVKVWDLEFGEVLYTINKHSDCVTSVAFSSDGQTFASASWDKTIRIWDLDSGEELCSLQNQDYVTSIVFSVSGALLISGGYDGTIKIWGVIL
ncbi:MAG: WD40 repeat domain-containing protein [Okeania sp. SIO2H7]|nr:WD40 repeat domain-containing protein [Okeania sp. SIO2H7]